MFCFFIFLPNNVVIEGGSSKDYGKIKKFLFEKPDIAHLLLRKLADNIVDYTKYQIENGAQIVQLFDSWAAHLTPNEYNAFAAHYHKYIIDRVKKTYPDVPLILFVHKGVGSYLDQIQESGADIVSIDWTVNAKDIRNRLDTSKMIKNMQAQFLQGKDKVGNKNLIEKDMGIQGNLDPMILHTNKDIIERETKKILDQLNGKNHIMNLGHGIDSTTKEENVKHFVNYVRNYKIKK